MTDSYPFYVVNAFAEKPFGGNPAGVFCDARGLTDLQMQAIAKQLNLVETVFITPAMKDADFRLRYFTPHKELPIAGHPTIAAWAALILSGHININQEKFTQLTGKGVQEISVACAEGTPVIWMKQSEPKFHGKLNPADIVTVFQITSEEILPDMVPESIDTGLGHIIFGVKSIKSLMKIRRNIEALNNLCQSCNASEAQIFTPETYDPMYQFHTRNICPREGIEDPACGVGNAALMAYFLKNGYPLSKSEISIEQGHIEDMPSVIKVKGARDSQGSYDISIGGSGTIMVKGEFYLGPTMRIDSKHRDNS